MNNIDKLNKILRDVFNIKDDCYTKDELGPDEIEGWDSLAHVDLVTNLEEQFEISLDVIDISRMYTIGDIKNILKKYGVSI
ncbi:acyl carrier protein [Clostridium tetanomorphum]|uniref:Acyl carrier protein n=1 Tax=Clostridium tetanomorphum TaxID=1553 RepID=A0A923J167_CLOTT|nr:acyl carrier protein [Clostridium tetanomorphum]KAJ52003.1 acyl carrier protein [Clostridium tetanomorphum DSM 665]MBC2397013.1 acyl carrier protein [Clostridium tetanomorphum]MBP1862923.1 acyl carrier protein [Clostridium tetanomorphum]NRS87060.1 acyl carrier protein [Clostridium tetanomorphum]NRZ99145.1 acyl carrier protein [Clostridium tetanomorphum]